MTTLEAIKILTELTTRIADCRCGNIQLTVPEMDAIQYAVKLMGHLR